MAYIKERAQRRCFRCPREATHEVYNTRNSLDNYACLRHAKERQRELAKIEEAGGQTK